ncbi:hypothetical protein MFIFM68171_10810 [Madurella fahalii]|uniref:DRBM domain-containing protein n=1 Tax=Madurella fahalii TaxID=1157608 RepID=A0ABQ0GS78_9PEZI
MTANNSTNNSNGSAGGSLLEDPIDYTDLKVWIHQQETNPKPISSLQRRALSDLILSLRSEEPELGDRDWISLLQQYVNLRKPKGASAGYRVEDAPKDKWSCLCTFKPLEDIDTMTFPNEDFGFVHVGNTLDMPVFARKKDAKKYAAKCCVEWLVARDYMHLDGEKAVFPIFKNIRKSAAAQPSAPPPPPPPPPPTSKTNGTATPSQQAGGGKMPKPAHDHAAATTTSNRAAADVYDDDIPATQRVNEMCRRLRIVAPQYKITASDKQNCFRGYPDFGNDSVMMPEGLGKVDGIYGKEATRGMIAEHVLAWLLEEEKRRKNDEDEVLPVVNGEGEGAALDAGGD